MKYHHPPVGYDPEELEWIREQKRFNRFITIISILIFSFAIGAFFYAVFH
jgi:hypothetical protein